MSKQRRQNITMLYSARTSVDKDGTLKFVNYKVGGTQNPYSFTETQYFFDFLCVKILPYANKT